MLFIPSEEWFLCLEITCSNLFFKTYDYTDFRNPSQEIYFNALIVTCSKKVCRFFPSSPHSQVSADFLHSSRLRVRRLSVQTMMEVGRQRGSIQCSHALCCFSFSFDCCSAIINIIDIALFRFHLDWTRFCSLCAIWLQCRVVQKHLQRKSLIDHLLDLPLLNRVKAV